MALSYSRSYRSREPTRSGFTEQDEAFRDQLQGRRRAIVVHHRDQLDRFQQINRIPERYLEPCGIYGSGGGGRRMVAGRLPLPNPWRYRTEDGERPRVRYRVNDGNSDVIIEVTLWNGPVLSVHVPRDSWERRTCNSENVRAALQTAHLNILRHKPPCPVIVHPNHLPSPVYLTERPRQQHVRQRMDKRSRYAPQPMPLHNTRVQVQQQLPALIPPVHVIPGYENHHLRPSPHLSSHPSLSPHPSRPSPSPHPSRPSPGRYEHTRHASRLPPYPRQGGSHHDEYGRVRDPRERAMQYTTLYHPIDQHQHHHHHHHPPLIPVPSPSVTDSLVLTRERWMSSSGTTLVGPRELEYEHEHGYDRSKRLRRDSRGETYFVSPHGTASQTLLELDDNDYEEVEGVEGGSSSHSSGQRLSKIARSYEPAVGRSRKSRNGGRNYDRDPVTVVVPGHGYGYGYDPHRGPSLWKRFKNWCNLCG